jgi:hypothetical protein
MTVAAIIYTILSGIIILFQLCLAAGLPWGAASMGGKFPGKYPTKMRFVALINVLLLIFLTVIVLSSAKLILPQLNNFSSKAIWGVIVFSLLGTILNTITPSKIERIWAPVILTQLICSLYIAVN